MSRWASVLLIGALLPATASGQERFPGIGRNATPAEVRAWDIDVRADFKGLPAGSGSVAKGREVWDAQCASCHGTFGESNEVFPPLIGGTTREDVKTGRVKALTDADTPRSTLMKLARLSTLWDYINRAMPWTAPKTLTTEEVYAVTAFILNMGDLVAEDFVLSDRNIAEVQQKLPNRNGLTREHGLWSVRGKPDVKHSACMRDCEPSVKISSRLPDQAKDAHGNLAEQMRTIGPVRGVRTVAESTAQAQPAAAGAKSQGHPGRGLASNSGCLACHGVTSKLVGPALTDISAKYQGQPDASSTLASRVKQGSSGVWGAVPMPPQAHLKDEDVRAMVSWILSGAK